MDFLIHNGPCLLRLIADCPERFFFATQPRTPLRCQLNVAERQDKHRLRDYFPDTFCSSLPGVTTSRGGDCEGNSENYREGKVH
jgi:hypothetical protein